MFRDLTQKLSAFAEKWTLVILIAAAVCALLYGAWTDSAIMDELAHIPAGYGYVAHLDFRLNPEHPPLVKALAAFPLLVTKVQFPTESAAWTQDVNGQWAMGNQFLYESGNDTDNVIFLSRFGPILLTILAILFLYSWSKERLGRWWALIPVVLFGLSPNILAHGHYVTTDVAAAFGILVAMYYFLRFLKAPSREHLFTAALAFGFAQIAKFSVVLLIPYFLFLAIAVPLITFRRGTYPAITLRQRGKKIVESLGSFFLIAATGYVLVVYPVYFLFTFHYPAERQTSDTSFILTSFAGGPTPQGKFCLPMRCLADLDIWMTKNPVTRPAAEYFLGVLMVIQRSSGGNTNYFLGHVSAAGSPLYFPAVYLFKEPLPTLTLVGIALLLSIGALWRALARGRAKLFERMLAALENYFIEFAMLGFVALYWVYSIKSPLNIGFRHLFPALPFMYFLTAAAWKRWLTKDTLQAHAFTLAALKEGLRSIARTGIKYALLILLLLWLVLETFFHAPYFLSYFNELGGGTQNGYRYVTDSNYDWGQDLLRLQIFVSQHSEIDRIAVDYFGGGNPKYYLGDKEEYWWSSRGNPAESGIHWLAVSVNPLQGAIQPLVPGQRRDPQDEYRWLTALRPPTPGLGNVPEPNYKVGTSIFVYKL